MFFRSKCFSQVVFRCIWCIWLSFSWNFENLAFHRLETNCSFFCWNLQVPRMWKLQEDGKYFEFLSVRFFFIALWKTHRTQPLPTGYTFLAFLDSRRLLSRSFWLVGCDNEGSRNPDFPFWGCQTWSFVPINFHHPKNPQPDRVGLMGVSTSHFQICSGHIGAIGLVRGNPCLRTYRSDPWGMWVRSGHGAALHE